MVRYLTIILITLLTIYSPLELTRAIFNWWFYWGEPMEWQFIFEIAFIWTLYLGAILIIIGRIK